MRKVIPTFFDWALLAFLIFCLPRHVAAQTSISGRVTGKDTVALPGASVVNKVNHAVAITDTNGRFTIMADLGDVLEISFVGYTYQKIDVANFHVLDIRLQEAIQVLTDVVVIGYGSSPRKDAVGSIVKLTDTDFNSGIITHPLQQLQGKLAGVNITQPGGDPNGDFTVRVRGASSIEGQPPLLVIDGVAIDDFNRAITTLHPADIASYDVLKDAASAAIYGSRGANGVILITTKKGKAGQTTVDYSGFTGIEIVSRQIDVLNAAQWQRATGGNSGLDHGADTNWQKEISRTGFTQSHQIGFSGGSNDLQFRGSMGYMRQQGIILNSGKEVVTARFSAQQTNKNKRLHINYALNASVINRSFLPDQNSSGQVLGFGSEIFGRSLSALPVQPVRNSDGSYFHGADARQANPVEVLNEVYSKRRENFLQASIRADYEFIDGLQVGLFGALSMGNNVFDYSDPGLLQLNGNAATKANTNKEVFSGDVHINYIKDWKQHHVQITGIYEHNRFLNDGASLTAYGFQFSDFLNNNLGAATQISTNDISSYKNEVRLISFLGRMLYHYGNRYFLTINFRRDGSSKFGPTHQWGTFPSVAVGWNVNEENFMKGFSWLNHLRVRGSYGLTGNQENLPANAYQLLYGSGGPFLYGNKVLQGYGSIREYNPDLKWEVRTSFNAGMDFGFLQDKIYGTIDIYNDRTSDMLFTYNLPQPPFLNNSVLANAANAINTGVEASIGVRILKKSRFQWNSQLNISRVHNQITNLAGQFLGVNLEIASVYGYAQGGGLSGAYVSLIQKGYPAGVLWLPVHAGFDAHGNELFNTYDKAGKFIGTSTTYGDQDRRYIDPSPDFTWGFTNSFTAGNIDFSIFFRGVQGQRIFNNTQLTLGSIVYLPGRNIVQEALSNGFVGQPQPSSQWVQDGSYLRLQNVTAGYTVNHLRGLSKLRVYATATNLFVVTSYPGIDPEINVEGSQRYIDSNYYPKTRGFILGVQANF